MLQKSALDQIPGYLAMFEGYFETIYNDSVNIATTGIGNRVEPYGQYGARFKFYRFKDNQQATAGEVQAEIIACKNPKTFKPGLYTTRAQIQEKSIGAFTANLNKAREYFGSDFDRFPADIQVVLGQMGYGGGLESRRVKLAPYLKRRDFHGAMTYTTLGPNHQRYNKAFRILMTNGWIVEESIKKGMAMKNWAPRDLGELWGIKRYLQLSRWYREDIIFELRTTDVITAGDCSDWLSKQPNRL